MKFCKNCKFYRESSAVSFYGAHFTWSESCRSPGPQPWPRELVTGELITGARDPLEQRKDESTCGMDGKWFQPIPIITEEIKEPVLEYKDRPVSIIGNCNQQICITNPWWRFWG